MPPFAAFFGADTPGEPRGGIGLVPTFDSMGVEEAAALLAGLVAVNRLQLAGGAPPVGPALASGRLKYIRLDPNERWRSVKNIWLAGGGDCEDLGSAVAAELEQIYGVSARAVIYKVRPGLSHCVTQITDRRFGLAPVGAKLFGHPVIARTLPDGRPALPGVPGFPLIDPSRTGGMGRE